MSHYRTRARRIRARVQAAAVLAGLLALTFLAGAASLGALRSAPAPQQRPAVTVRADTDPDDTVAAYTAGWRAGIAALGDSTRPTYPNVVTDGNDPGTLAWAHGWIDGQAAALGDDNRDGVVDEDESGWDCHRMGNRRCGSAPARAHH
ncbi:hypothetical protein ABT033_31380 [Streptomyces pharetrae]|uniref:hypothetical protein n=1 Tax=Streptomyces pharetrae TaxID=291370 RepID=UPI003345FC1D